MSVIQVWLCVSLYSTVKIKAGDEDDGFVSCESIYSGGNRLHSYMRESKMCYKIMVNMNLFYE